MLIAKWRVAPHMTGARPGGPGREAGSAPAGGGDLCVQRAGGALAAMGPGAAGGANSIAVCVALQRCPTDHTRRARAHIESGGLMAPRELVPGSHHARIGRERCQEHSAQQSTAASGRRIIFLAVQPVARAPTAEGGNTEVKQASIRTCSCAAGRAGRRAVPVAGRCAVLAAHCSTAPPEECQFSCLRSVVLEVRCHDSCEEKTDLFSDVCWRGVSIPKLHSFAAAVPAGSTRS